MMETKIEIVSREWVKPTTPTPHHNKEHKLSFIDQLQLPKFVSLLFIFDPKDHGKSSKETLHLKKSLSKCLTKFYPLSGKLVKPAGVLTVECDDTGALFVEAKVSETISKSLQNNGSWKKFGQLLPFEPYTNLDEQITPPYSSSLTYPKSKIPLVIQVTRFGCDGTAIGVCLSHKVGDAASLMAFLSSWTAENRGLPEEQTAVNFDVGREVFPPSPTSLDVIMSHRRIILEQLGEKKVVSKRFVFDEETITQLKQLAVSFSSVVSPTRVEVIASFLWKQIIHVQVRKDPTHG